MSAFIILTAARIETSVRGLAARISDDERGQDTIEYIGVLLVVAALIGVVVGIVQTHLGNTIESGATSLIGKVFSGGSSG